MGSTAPPCGRVGGVTSKQRLFLRVFAAWTVWVWGTRIWNVIGDDTRGTAFKAVHVVLAAVSVVFAVGTWIITTGSSERQSVSSS
jgi:hypothetical protein